MSTTSLAKAPAFARVRVTDFGSVTEVTDFDHTVDDTVTIWTRCEADSNPFAVVDRRGLVTDRSSDEMIWLPADARVEIVEPPRYAGQPEDVVKDAVPVPAPAGSQGAMQTPEGWPPLIWNNDLLFSPVANFSDAEIAVEVLLCAITVAPSGDPDLRAMLLAALQARYAKVVRDPRTYPPRRYPWRGRTHPPKHFHEYLEG